MLSVSSIYRNIIVIQVLCSISLNSSPRQTSKGSNLLKHRVQTRTTRRKQSTKQLDILLNHGILLFSLFQEQRQLT